MVVGARTPLIAFNAVLGSDAVDIAKAVAVAIRTSSGGLADVRAMGVFLASRGLVQVSMNLLDCRHTSPRVVAERIEAEARRRGVGVVEYELVGCAPPGIFEKWPSELAPLAGLKPAQILDRRLFSHVTS
jgi:glutamate formiminotransferase